jgi:cytoskeletal protein CcmA (bactofilin family)
VSRAADPGAPRLGAGTSFDGVLSFEGSLRVDGELAGSVYATDGALFIGPQARVRARIEVAELVLAGAIVGNVIARRRVELLPGAELDGDVTSPLLAIADGGRIAGRCTTGAQALTTLSK